MLGGGRQRWGSGDFHLHLRTGGRWDLLTQRDRHGLEQMVIVRRVFRAETCSGKTCEGGLEVRAGGSGFASHVGVYRVREGKAVAYEEPSGFGLRL